MRLFLFILALLPSLALANPKKATDAVQAFAVPDPAAVQAAVTAWEREVASMPPPDDVAAPWPPPLVLEEPLPTVTLGQLIEDGHLEATLGVEGLEHGEWKAKKLRGSSYLVRKIYTRNGASIGAGWVVDLSSGAVTPKNDLARVFHQSAEDPDTYYFAQELMAHRLRPVASKMNAYQLSLAASALAMFAYNSDPGNENDAVLGWLIDHSGGDDYVAIFQWRTGGEPKNARWRIERPSRHDEPLAAFLQRSSRASADNLPARSMHTDIQTFGLKSDQFLVLPPDYIDLPMLPRDRRFTGDLRKGCKKKKLRKLCSAFHRVLEDEALIQAARALVAAQVSASHCSEADFKRGWTCPDAVAAYNTCRNDGLCKWSFAELDKEHFEISYLYESADAELGLSFRVHAETGEITPLDVGGAWVLRAAGLSHGPDTTLVEPQRQVAFFQPEQVEAHRAMVVERLELASAATQEQGSATEMNEGAGRTLEDDEVQNAVYSSPTIDTITQCLEAEYERTGGVLDVKANVTFTLKTNGKLIRLRTDAWSVELDQCLKGAFDKLKFKPFDGLPRTITFPLEFG